MRLILETWQYLIFQIIPVIDGSGIALIWMSLDRTVLIQELIPRLRSLLRHQRPGKLTTARGRSPRAVVSFPGRWWRNNDRNGGINFYSIMMKQNQLQINKRMQGKCSKLPQNCLSYSMVTCAQLAIVQWSHVTWLFLPGNTCSNHCDVKTRFVTLNLSHTLHKNNWQNTHHNSW